jgi:hypothetical protein
MVQQRSTLPWAMQTILEPSECPVSRGRRGRGFSLGMLVSEADLSNPIGWMAVDRPLRDTDGATAMSDRMNTVHALSSDRWLPRG